MPRPEFSAGGVVVRETAGGPDFGGHTGRQSHPYEMIVIVPVKRAANGTRVLGLPKGHPDGDETAEQAAAREVSEETGVSAELVGDLGETHYSYERKGRRVAKRVAFFLFRYRSGDVEDHDHEIEEARWMPLEEAARSLTYVGERAVVKRALSLLAADR